jgi:hypothetical protein
MTKTTVARDGQPPIIFTGELIGFGSNQIINGRENSRWTEVHIWSTKGGKYVAQVKRLTCWQDECARLNAQSFCDPNALIEWLKEGSEDLGSVSQEAVEEACKKDEKFSAAWIEVVD